MQIKWWPLPEPWNDRVVMWALWLFVGILPFQLIFPPITAGIVAVCLTVVLRGNFRENGQNLKKNPPFWVAMVLFGLVLMGLFYTSNPHEGGMDVMLKISMCLLPIAFAALPPIAPHRIRYALMAFVAAVFLATFIALLRAGWVLWTSGDNYYFTYNNFTISKFVSMHYLALYVSFALLLVFIDGLQWLSRGSLKALLHLGLMGYFIGILVILSVRMQFIALAVAGFATLIAHLRTHGHWKRGLLLFGGALGLMVVLIFSFKGSRTRMVDLWDEVMSWNAIQNNKQTNPRKYIWAAGFEVVAANPLLGTGTGAADDALNDHLATCTAQFWDGQGTYQLNEKRYNYHNEYLQHFATHGVGGFVALLGLFVLPLFRKHLMRQPAVVAFLTLTAVSFFTESMLERQAGVLFFAFFYGLMVMNAYNKR